MLTRLLLQKRNNPKTGRSYPHSLLSQSKQISCRSPYSTRMPIDKQNHTNTRLRAKSVLLKESIAPRKSKQLTVEHEDLHEAGQVKFSSRCEGKDKKKTETGNKCKILKTRNLKKESLPEPYSHRNKKFQTLQSVETINKNLLTTMAYTKKQLEIKLSQSPRPTSRAYPDSHQNEIQTQDHCLLAQKKIEEIMSCLKKNRRVLHELCKKSPLQQVQEEQKPKNTIFPGLKISQDRRNDSNDDKRKKELSFEPWAPENHFGDFQIQNYDYE